MIGEWTATGSKTPHRYGSKREREKVSSAICSALRRASEAAALSSPASAMADAGVLDKENMGVLRPSKSLGKRHAEAEAATDEQAKRKAVLRPSTRVTTGANFASEPARNAQPAVMGPPPPRPPAADAGPAVSRLCGHDHKHWSRWHTSRPKTAICAVVSWPGGAGTAWFALAGAQ